jgi:PLP dependent protein
VSILLLTDMADAQRASGGLGERLGVVRARIEGAALKCNRTPGEVKLIAISKTHPASAVTEALELGLTDFGENRLQEAEAKIIKVGRHQARWHLVGHLQANKARRALKVFDVIHSVDSIELALRLDRLCSEEGREELPVLIQVDLGQEETKSGISEADLPDLVQSLDKCSQLRLSGLMTLPPFFENPEKARPFFRRLRELRDEIARLGHFHNGTGELSMGMTHDFEVAIAEGATMIRVGTAIFGERLPRT